MVWRALFQGSLLKRAWWRLWAFALLCAPLVWFHVLGSGGFDLVLLGCVFVSFIVTGLMPKGAELYELARRQGLVDDEDDVAYGPTNDESEL